MEEKKNLITKQNTTKTYFGSPAVLIRRAGLKYIIQNKNNLNQEISPNFHMESAVIILGKPIGFCLSFSPGGKTAITSWQEGSG